MIFRPAILYVDDEPANLRTFERSFKTDYLVKTCASAQEALDILAEEDFPLIIADQRMPGMTGIELCEKLVSLKPQTVRMILTAYTETEMLLAAINKGHVHDYLVKPWRKSELKPIFEAAFDDYKKRVLKLRDLEQRAQQSDLLREEVDRLFDVKTLIGADQGLAAVTDIMRKVAPTESTVLIQGETGTGKEVIARMIHANSQRSSGPFVAVHCAALAKTVLESELFGHEKGAFTGADQQRIGRFEQANGGTVFLDEISEVPAEVQVKLLRVLQEREIQRVGGNQALPIDVRILAATNKNLSQAVSEGRFREDLFFRLNVIPLAVPPLRERREDMNLLADYFLKKASADSGRSLSLNQPALEHLSSYDWPGNVRELQNVLERAAILAPADQIDIDDLHLEIDEILQAETVELKVETSVTVRDQIKQKEMSELCKVLQENQGNVAAAARSMGIARTTLFHRLKKYGLI